MTPEIARPPSFHTASTHCVDSSRVSRASGLNMLADFQPDQIKIDMNLVRGTERHGPRQSIVRAVVQVCGDLGIDVIAEGVESLAEYTWFAEQGVCLFQGYLFAKPGFESLPQAQFPDCG